MAVTVTYTDTNCVSLEIELHTYNSIVTGFSGAINGKILRIPDSITVVSPTTFSDTGATFTSGQTYTFPVGTIKASAFENVDFTGLASTDLSAFSGRYELGCFKNAKFPVHTTIITRPNIVEQEAFYGTDINIDLRLESSGSSIQVEDRAFYHTRILNLPRDCEFVFIGTEGYELAGTSLGYSYYGVGDYRVQINDDVEFRVWNDKISVNTFAFETKNMDGVWVSDYSWLKRLIIHTDGQPINMETKIVPGPPYSWLRTPFTDMMNDLKFLYIEQFGTIDDFNKVVQNYKSDSGSVQISYPDLVLATGSHGSGRCYATDFDRTIMIIDDMNTPNPTIKGFNIGSTPTTHDTAITNFLYRDLLPLDKSYKMSFTSTPQSNFGGESPVFDSRRDFTLITAILDVENSPFAFSQPEFGNMYSIGHSISFYGDDIKIPEGMFSKQNTVSSLSIYNIYNSDTTPVDFGSSAFYGCSITDFHIDDPTITHLGDQFMSGTINNIDFYRIKKPNLGELVIDDNAFAALNITPTSGNTTFTAVHISCETDSTVSIGDHALDAFDLVVISENFKTLSISGTGTPKMIVPTNSMLTDVNNYTAGASASMEQLDVIVSIEYGGFLSVGRTGNGTMLNYGTEYLKLPDKIVGIDVTSVTMIDGTSPVNSNIKFIRLPKNAKNIRTSAFYKLSNLVGIHFNSSISSIEFNALVGLNMAVLTLPFGFTSDKVASDSGIMDDVTKANLAVTIYNCDLTEQNSIQTKLGLTTDDCAMYNMDDLCSQARDQIFDQSDKLYELLLSLYTDNKETRATFIIPRYIASSTDSNVNHSYNEISITYTSMVDHIIPGVMLDSGISTVEDVRGFCPETVILGNETNVYILNNTFKDDNKYTKYILSDPDTYIKHIGESSFENSIIEKFDIKHPMNQSYATTLTADIGNNAFKNAVNLDLTSDQLSRMLTADTIGTSAFYGCSKVGDNIKPLVCFDVDKIQANCFVGCNFSNVSINSGTKINSNAFTNAMRGSGGGLSISSSITQIDSYAFSNNQFNSSIDLYNTGIRTIEDYAFADCNIHSIKFPTSLVQLGDYIMSNNSYSTPSVEFTRDMVSMSYNTFALGSSSSVTTLTVLGYASSSIVNPVEFTPLYSTKISFRPKDLNYEVYHPWLSPGTSYERVNGFVSGFSRVDLVIPSRIDGNLVMDIKDDAFSYENLTSLTLPSTLDSIGDGSFSHNNLTTVYLPADIVTIKKNAFNSNELTGIVIPSQVTTIGDTAFANNNLSSVSLPSSLDTISAGSFENNSLTQLTIPSGVVFMRSQAFANNKISSITIAGNNLKLFGGFSGNELTSLTGYPDSVTELFEFDNMPTLDSVVIKPNVATVDNGTFDKCKLSSFEIQSETHVVDYDSNLKNKTYSGGSRFKALSNNPMVPAMISNSSWGFDPIDLDYSLVGGGYTIAGRNSSLSTQVTKTKLYIPATIMFKPVDTIGSGAFDNDGIFICNLPDCTNLKQIKDTAFKNCAFSGDLHLEGLTQLTSIGANAFYGNNISSVTLPSNLTSVQDGCFGSNANLSTVKINKKDLTITPTSFATGNSHVKVYGYSAGTLEAVVDPAPNQFFIPMEFTIDANGYITGFIPGFNNLNIKIPDVIDDTAVKGIADNAFKDKNAVTLSINSNTMISIGNSAFRNNKFTTIDLSDTKTETIGSYAFYDCTNLNTVTLNPEIKNINTSAFQHTAMRTINTESTQLNVLSDNAFNGCQLTSLELPTSVSSVGSGSFANNSTLNTIIINGTGTDVNPNNFTGVPASVKIEASTHSKLYDDYVVSHIDSIVYVPLDLATTATTNGSLNAMLVPYSTLKIPKKVWGVPLTNIASSAFKNKTVITDIDFSKSVLTTIGNDAFSGCNINTHLDLPNTITSLGSNAFYNNSIPSINVPPGLTVYESGVFMNNAISAITFNDNLTSIKANAFKNNHLSNTITIPASCDIHEATSAFENNNIKAVQLADSPNHSDIPSAMFKHNVIESFTITPHLQYIRDNAFMDNQLPDIELHTTVKYIGTDAFKNNKMNSIVLHPWYDTVGDGAFDGNNEMKVIGYVGSKADTCVSNSTDAVFVPLDGDTGIFDITGSTLSGYKDKTYKNTSLFIKSNINGNDIENIGDNAFAYMSIDNYSIPGTLKTIGDSSFAGNNLKVLDLPLLNTIGDNAFKSNILTAFTFGTHLTDIGSSAFMDNDFLAIDTSDASALVNIGSNAFKGNDIYSTIVINSSVRQIGGGAFSGNHVPALVLHEGVVTIGDSAFYGNQIKHLSLPDSVTTLGSESFKSNGMLVAYIPVTCTTIKTDAFADNPDLSIHGFIESVAKEYADANNISFYILDFKFTDTDGKITITGFATGFTDPTLVIPSTLRDKPVVKIDTGAFSNKGLKTLVLPMSLTQIESNAFSNNELTDITIPASVYFLGDHSFYNNKITTLTLNDGLKTISDSSFEKNELSTIAIPDSTVTIGAGAFKSNNISSFTWSNSCEVMSNGVLDDNKLVRVVIPNSVHEIQANAVGNNLTLTTVVSNNKLKSIDPTSFIRGDNGHVNLFGYTGSNLEALSKVESTYDFTPLIKLYDHVEFLDSEMGPLEAFKFKASEYIKHQRYLNALIEELSIKGSVLSDQDKTAIDNIINGSQSEPATYNKVKSAHSTDGVNMSSFVGSGANVGGVTYVIGMLAKKQL